MSRYNSGGRGWVILIFSSQGYMCWSDFLLFFCDALVHSTTLSSLTLNVKYSLEEVFYDRPLSDVPTVSRDPSLKLRVEKIFVLPRILGGTAKSGFIRIEKKKATPSWSSCRLHLTSKQDLIFLTHFKEKSRDEVEFSVNEKKTGCPSKDFRRGLKNFSFLCPFKVTLEKLLLLRQKI